MIKKFLIVLVILVALFSTGLIAKAVGKVLTETAEIRACVKTAVEKRETAIQTAFDKFSEAIKLALQTRKNELLSAWDITDKNERKTAIRNAWNKFKNEKRNAIRNFNQARLSAWQQFITERKACKALPTGEIPGADLSF
ncbi:MAG: hypothetical protein ACK413_02380 [Patescibacteria group bacterium]